MTVSKIKKIKRRILDSLKDKAELSINRGRIESVQFAKPNKKVRRHSGRYTPLIHQKGKFSDMIADAEEPIEEYDDWMEYRDGQRGDYDKTKLRKDKGSLWQDEEEVRKINKKIRKQLAIKRAKKYKKLIKGATSSVEIDSF